MPPIIPPVIEPFELFLEKLFSTETSFSVAIQWDAFQKVDLIINNNDKWKLNYDFIFIEAKNRSSIKEDDVTNFVNDVNHTNFKKFNILGIFCTTKDLPPEHYKKILESPSPVIILDKKGFEEFFNSSISIIEFLNLKLNKLLDIQKKALIFSERAATESIKSSLKS